MSTALTGLNVSQLMSALLSADDSTGKTRVDRVVRQRTKDVALISQAASYTCYPFSVVAEQGITVTGVKYFSSATLASGATDFWTFKLSYNDDAGGSPTDITNTLTGTVTSIAAETGVAFALSTTGGVAVPTGSTLKFVATKTASGTTHIPLIRISYTEN